MSQTYLTTDELLERIKYDPRTIRDRLKDSVLLEGRHYFRPFGGRKILYISGRPSRKTWPSGSHGSPKSSPWPAAGVAVASIRLRSATGCLFLDIRYRGIRCREQTSLPDTPANRKKLQAVLDRIEAEITLSTFDYTRYFPNSPMATQFAVTMPQGIGQYPQFRNLVDAWLSQKEPEWRRPHFTQIHYMLDHWLLPIFGGRPINLITKTKILNFRAEVLRRPGPVGNEHLSPWTLLESHMSASGEFAP